MQKNKEKLFQEIKDITTKQEYQEEIEKRKKEYDNLLDEDTIALLIVDELGRNKQNISKISQLKPGKEYTILGKITNIGEKREFQKKNGSKGRVINLEISDDTGKCNLVLWDKDVELVKKEEIKEGTIVKVINGYTKEGYSGIDINLGRWGLLKTNPEHDTDLTQVKESENDIRGTLVEMEPTNAFFKNNGEFGFVRNIKIKGNKGTKKVSVWDKKVKEIQKLNEGDQIEIKNIDTRYNKNKKELHVDGKATIKKI